MNGVLARISAPGGAATEAGQHEQQESQRPHADTERCRGLLVVANRLQRSAGASAQQQEEEPSSRTMKPASSSRCSHGGRVIEYRSGRAARCRCRRPCCGRGRPATRAPRRPPTFRPRTGRHAAAAREATRSPPVPRRRMPRGRWRDSGVTPCWVKKMTLYAPKPMNACWPTETMPP